MQLRAVAAAFTMFLVYLNIYIAFWTILFINQFKDLQTAFAICNID